MQPLTLSTPKPMLKVLGRPILEHITDSLPSEVDQVIIIVGYLGDQIRKHFGDSWRGRKIHYAEQKELNGHVPALNLARPFLDPQGPFLFMFADDIHDAASIRRLSRHPRAILAARSEHPERFGVVVADESNRMVEFEEKPKQPKSNLVWTGACLLDEKFFNYEPEQHENGEYYLAPVVVKMIKDHPVYVEEEDLWLPIGYPEDIAKAEEVLRQRVMS